MNPHAHTQVIHDCFTCDPTRIMHVSVLSVFSFIALVSVFLRLWARKLQRSVLELNDYLCLVGLVFTLAVTVFTIYAAIYWARGSTMEFSVIKLQFQALLVGQLLWITSVTFIRASVLSLYIRIFRTSSFRSTCYVVHAINLAYFVGVVVASCSICRPLSFNWDPTIKGTCGNQKSLDLFMGIFNLLMDVTTVALPMPVLWGLQLPTSKRLATGGMFSMGIAICAITLVRIKVTSEINGQNGQRQSALIALLTCLEASFGVVNACLPVIKPIFDRLAAFGSFATTSRRSGKRSQSSRTPRGIHASSGRPQNRPKISHPIFINGEPSDPIFGHEPTVSTYSLPLSLSPHSLSLFRMSRANWSARDVEMEKGNEVHIRTDETFKPPFSEDPSPTHPLPPLVRNDLESDPKSPDDRLPVPPSRR